MTIQRALHAFFLAAFILTPPLATQPAFAQEPAPAQAQNLQPAKPVDLAMTRAVLYSSGVAYFEHQAQVTDDATVVLPFKTEQINDILKSMVIIDDSGKPATVTYPSNDPVNRSLKSFGVDISGPVTIPRILAQLQGVAVRLEGPQTVEGTLLSIEEITKVTHGSSPVETTDYTVSLVTPTGIRSVSLSAVSNVTILDPRLQEELAKALALVAASRDTQRKPVTIHLKGKGPRTVRIGYLLESPVWKSTYRLDLSDKPILQGWALVENTSDTDWNKVGLSLVSGRPISFQMNLYTPMYLDRPFVQPQYFQFLKSRISEAGIEDEPMVPLRRSSSTSGGSSSTFSSGSPGFASGEGGSRRIHNGAANVDPSLNDAIGGLLEVATQSGQMGELFKFTLPDPVTMPRRQSAMLAIISKPIKAQKLSLYNQRTLGESPLNGVRITNDTGMKLLTGPVTVFDGGAYAGDAQIDNLVENESRLLTYGVDLAVKIQHEYSEDEEIIQDLIVKGVFHQVVKSIGTHEYKIKNNADKDRLIVIEQPRATDYQLKEPAKPDETTTNFYRFNVTVPAGKTITFKVALQNQATQTTAITDITTEKLQLIIKNNQLPDKVQQALAKAIQMRTELSELEQLDKQLAAELSAITQEQNRLRENIKTLGSQSTTSQRYITKLSDQETRIDAINAQSKTLQTQITEKRKTLSDYLLSLTLQ